MKKSAVLTILPGFPSLLIVLFFSIPPPVQAQNREAPDPWTQGFIDALKNTDWAIRNRMDLIKLGDRGISKTALVYLAQYLSFTMSQVAAILPVTERTIQRYAPKEHFSRIISEQILQIAEVAVKGTEVFRDKEKFFSWMNHPHKAFADKTPVSLLCSRFGAEMVLDELGRIEHGVFS